MPNPDVDPSLRERLTLLPKTDLHLHVVGGLRPETVVELARAKNAPILEAAERGAAVGGYEFEDLPDFIAFFLGLFQLVTEPSDFERVTYEVLMDAARVGTRYAELRWTPTSHLSRGAEEFGMFDGIAAGCRAARRASGIESRLIVDFPRSLTPDVAETALHVALRQSAHGITGFDVAGDEKAVSVDAAFAPYFQAARRAGLRLAAHAGEAAGSESVAGALDVYGAERIGHGTRSIEDPDLVARLAREGIVLEVCLSSNVALSVVPSAAAHPVRAFREAGVPCVVATDDPTLFATDIVEEYVRLHREVGLSLEELGHMAARGFEAAFVEEGETGDALRAALEAWRREATAWAEDAGAPSRDSGA